MKEYIENKCIKCKNKDNTNDLCHITKNIDGNCKCHNEDITDWLIAREQSIDV